jgi:acetyl-CoA C-acetyltransferase
LRWSSLSYGTFVLIHASHVRTCLVIGAGLPKSTICTTINKVCASGMKSVILASQMIQCGGLENSRDAVLAGGFESMSNVPHYLMSSRSGIPLGNSQLIDGVIHDGLWDIYNNQHMGMCAEKCATDYSISREEQDFYAIESYKRAHKYIESGIFSSEIENVSIPQKRGDSLVVDSDEEPFGVDLEKMSTLRPAFDRKNGTVTAANASSLNDGAAAMVLMSEGSALELGLKPLARVLSSGEAAQDPVDFTTSPSLAVRVASKNAGIDLSDIEYHEINEAFSVVVSIWIDDAYLYIYCF